MNSKPILAIPMGDPAGIGPEIVLKTLSRGVHVGTAVVIVVGDRYLFEKTAEDCALGNPFDAIVTSDAECRQALAKQAITILYHLPLVDLKTFSYGRLYPFQRFQVFRYLSLNTYLFSLSIYLF